jgi:uncharacterized protein (TIGR00730 family)
VAGFRIRIVRGAHVTRVCIFCGSSSGARPEYAALARATGEVMLAREIGLVYGGAAVGLMGIIADTVLAGGGEVIGVIPERLSGREIAHAGLTKLHVVGSMHERKALMADLSDAFVALPGGLGTMDELFEIATWSYLGIHGKPIGLINAGGYYDPLLAFLEHAANEGFIRETHRRLIRVATTPDEVFSALLARSG